MPPRRTTPMGYLWAHQLRKEPTTAEAKLWAYLRRNKLNGVYFRRQHAIGQYIVDFCSLKKKLIIELDGSQHLEQKEHDEERTLYLQSLGYKVIRFWNNQVMSDTEGVIGAIIHALGSNDKAARVDEDGK
jgi:very-short-patch-repair endonuclease